MTNPLVFKMAQVEPWRYAGEKSKLLVALYDKFRDTYAIPESIVSLFLVWCLPYKEEL
jgi:hypothetical protein